MYRHHRSELRETGHGLVISGRTDEIDAEIDPSIANAWGQSFIQRYLCQALGSSSHLHAFRQDPNHVPMVSSDAQASWIEPCC